MKRYKLTIFALCAVCLLNACKKPEETLIPSGIVDTYLLPQGNNTFDKTIVEYYNSYGSYLLYKFNDKDVYWTPTGAWSSGSVVAPADPQYIPAQLELIRRKWFSFYSDAFLKKFLPTKIMLCSKVDSTYTSYVFTPTYKVVNGTKKVAAFYNYDNIDVNYGDASINTMTPAEERQFIYKVNTIFMQCIQERGLTKPTTAFTTSADYVTAMTTTAQSYRRGIIAQVSKATAQLDWNTYMLAMVGYSITDLNVSTPITDTTPKGMLNPVKDVNGLIKKRYTFVRDYFINEYGVDLQLIGNATKG